MKKHIIAVLSCIIAVFVLVGATSTAFAAFNPNFSEVTKKSTYKYNGYIQCQPSYVSNGMHAVYAYFQFTQKNSAGTIISKSPITKTARGSGPNDKSVLSAEYTFTGKSVSPSTILFDPNWDWYPDNGSWPFSNPEKPITD